MVTNSLEKDSLEEIQDVDLVAYLITLGFKLACPARNSNNRYISFLFQKSGDLDQACLNFFERKGKLEDVRTYAENLRTLYRTVNILKRKGGDR